MKTTDIHIKKPVEKIEELEKEVAFYKKIADHTYEWEIFRDRSGKILYVNKAFERITGFSVSDLLNGVVTEKDFVHPDDYNSVNESIKQALKQQVVEDFNFRVLRKDGTIRFVNLFAVPVYENQEFNGIRASIRDITLQKDFTDLQKLREKSNNSRNLMQYVIEHDRSAIALLNRNLEYIYVSRRFLEDYRVKEKDVIGKLHYEVFPDLPESWKDVHRRTLSGEILSSEEDQYPKSDGTIEWVRWESRPWYEQDNLIGGIILYTEVITKQKEAELEMIKSKEKAEESDRLKTAFLQNMSHEVRTPLNSIVGFSELLTEPGRNLEEIKTFSRIIRESSSKLIQIISDVIEVSKIQAKQTSLVFKKFDIVSLITSVADDYEEIAKQKNITFRLEQDIPVKKSVVYTDYEKLQKITSHLIDNAIKFTDNGSVEVISEIQHDNFVLTVSDTGIGISNEMQKIIFEPFHQIDSRLSVDQSGNGLGLAIVRAYIDLLGGHISLKSEKGLGTMITVSIPLNKSIKEIQKTGREVPEHIGSGDTILVAEDEYGNYRYLYEVLLADKLHVVHANNGQEAIDICKRSEEISLVLMDIKMPVMNGITAARLIKEFRPNLPIIAQTAYAGESVKLSNIDVFDDLIAKPINRSELKRKMKRYISH